MKRVYVINKQWARSGSFSGYQRVVDYFNCEVKSYRPLKIPYRIAKFFTIRTKLVNYQSKTFTKEFRILTRLFKKKKILITYGDMDYYYLHLIKFFPFNLFKNEVTVTFHHPPYELENRLQYDRRKILGTIDKIIVMGSNQIPFFKQYTDARIQFIPHGINTSFFKPSVASKRKKQIFIFGVSHRDHDRNFKIIEGLLLVFDDLSIVVVMAPKEAALYRRFRGVKIITRKITDEELLQFYHESSCCLLSLKDCTASNVILEALATGCPLIVNDVGAVKEYLPEESGIRVFKDYELSETINYIEEIINSSTLYSTILKKQVTWSKHYDWELIAKKTLDFIEL